LLAPGKHLRSNASSLVIKAHYFRTCLGSGELDSNFLHQLGLVEQNPSHSQNLRRLLTLQGVGLKGFMRTSPAIFTAKTSLLGLGLFTIVLIFTLGCGAGAGIHGVPPNTSTGNYSNASLKGSYVYQLSGNVSSTGTSYQEAGVFIADGAGHITGGVDDATQGTLSSVGNTISGTYAIASDGTGTISLSGTAFTGATLAVTLVSSAKAYLIEADPLNAAGVAELQSASAIGAPPTGTFVFKTHISAGQISTSTVGQFTVSTGNFQSGFVDVNHAGSFSSPTLSNFTFNAPISNGRGTGSYTESPGSISSFYYYIVDSNNIRLLSSDFVLNAGGIGRVESQSAGPFSTSSLSGSYVFGSKGDDNFGLNSVNTIGVFAASGGNITSGAFDSVEDGTPLTNVAITGGTYQVATNGRVTATLTSSVGTVNQILWMVSPARAFSITASDTSDTSVTQDGTDDLQQTTPFSNSSITGQFALIMHGFNSTVFLDRVATLQWDGNGNLKLNELVNANGAVTTPGLLTGTYSVAANGRVTGTINGLSAGSNDLVFYMISNASGNVLQEDANTELSGTTELQH